MDVKSFISQEGFQNLSLRLQNVKKEIEQNSFNLFTISSYNSYLENFHSDVIALLLNSNERHNQSNTFLNLFLEFLKNSGANIDLKDYALCEVTREKGRIDIWIKDNTSKKSIIIENKINDAIDQENQLETYYNYAIANGFLVDSIVYLTLGGNKKAPLTEILELNGKLINIPAFASNQNDLCNGWLLKCYNTVSEENSRSFIFQYLKLIKHLSQVGMDKQIKDDFYSIINQEQGFQKTKAIAELVAGLEEYRADRFMSQIGNDYLPFKKIYRWRPNHWLFESFTLNEVNYKLDVYFNSDGSARLDFWNPNQPEEIQKANISSKLKSIQLLDKFEYGGFGGGMFKIFKLEDFSNIQQVDDTIISFVKNLFMKLR